MDSLAGKVALITGPARGQGRSHAVELARAGADIIAVDLCEQIDSVPYPLASKDDLEETARAVRGLGRRIVPLQADVRNRTELTEAVDEGTGELGRLDIVCANAGIASIKYESEDIDSDWQDVIDVNLTGAFDTVQAALPGLPVDAGFTTK